MITEKLTKQEVHDANALLAETDSVAIVTHISPDGDALGSCLGMQHYLESLGKNLTAVVVPNHFPSFLEWMPGAENILCYDDNTEECNTILQEADLIICLDFNDLKRIGVMGEQVANAKAKKLLIDHHLFPQPFADVSISYPDIASTSELVFRLICRSGNFRLMDLPTAECIYTGMMTDTGNFSYNSNQADNYAIVYELVKLGVDKDAIYNKVFNTYSESRMRLMGYCLYRKMRIFPEHHTALIALTRRELYRFNFQAGDAEGLVNLPLQIENIYYSVFMREDKDKIKISFRSQGNRPVNEFANLFFNGGGHKNAAGGESYASVEDTIRLFEKHFKEYFH